MTKKDKVIILKKTIYHEYDEVVSVIGKEHGLFAFFAPGVRKPASRNKNGLILFSYSEVEVFLSYFTYRLSRLKKSLPQEIYLKSQTDLAYVRVLSFFSQIYTRFLTQRQPNPSAFNMLLIFLRKTNQKSICTLPFFVTLAFNFLFWAGYGWNLKYCLICNTKTFPIWTFDTSGKGFVCQKCYSKEPLYPKKLLTLICLLSKNTGTFCVLRHHHFDRYVWKQAWTLISRSYKNDMGIKFTYPY